MTAQLEALLTSGKHDSTSVCRRRSSVLMCRSFRFVFSSSKRRCLASHPPTKAPTIANAWKATRQDWAMYLSGHAIAVCSDIPLRPD